MHSPTEGHKEWIEIIPWTDDRKMYINLKKIEEQENDKQNGTNAIVG
jgi:hypothetical protein